MTLQKLGKLPPKHDKRTLQFGDYIDAEKLSALLPPAIVDWARKGSSNWGMMLNDTLGDCTCAAAGHLEQAWTANASEELTFPDSAILKAYEGACGYVPGDPSTDQGGVEIDVLNYWRKTGIDGKKIAAYVAVSPQNDAHFQLADWLFGGVYTGIGLPLSAQGQSSWFVPHGGAHGQGAPGSWGGHAVSVIASCASECKCVTWGGLLTMTTGFRHAYMDEAYAVLSSDWAQPGKVAPSGFALQDLLADVARVAG